MGGIQNFHLVQISKQIWDYPLERKIDLGITKLQEQQQMEALPSCFQTDL